MIPPYLWRQIRRRPGGVAAAALIGIVVSLLLCVLCKSRADSAKHMEEVYDRIDVTCDVTNLAGTKTDNLSAPEWVLRLFTTDVTTVNGAPLERSFSSFIEDVRIKGTLNAGSAYVGDIALTGITGLDVANALRAENMVEITWFDSYDGTVFAGDSPVCLVPEDIFESLPQDNRADRVLTLQIYPDDTGDEQRDVFRDFVIAGTYTGTGAVYCPWSVWYELSQTANGFCVLDSIGATFRSNGEIRQFWDMVGSLFFVEPSADGTKTEWISSPVYKYYPYALSINDTTLRQTMSSLSFNQSIMSYLSWAVIVLSTGGGFLTGFLLVRQRKRELALQRVLGVSLLSMFLGVMTEEWLSAAAGTVLCVAVFLSVTHASPPWGYIAVFLVVYTVGLSAALTGFLRKDFTRELEGE